jgi:hypothetical protein
MPSLLHNAVLKTFRRRGWHFREIAEREVIEADFEAHHTKVSLHVQSFGEARMAVVVSQSSFPFPPTHRSKVAELLMRANQQMTLGNLEMDWEGGAVFFRVTNIFAPDRYEEKILAAMVHAAVAEMDRLTPFLAELCRAEPSALAFLNVPALLAREDLLPPEPDHDGADAESSLTTSGR